MSDTLRKSRKSCPNCYNITCLSCEHITPNTNTCVECETDDNHIVIGSECFFCVCEGKSKDNFEYKPREVMSRAIEAVKLGKKHRKLGLSAPVLSNKIYEDLYELFMEGYNVD